MTRIHDHGQDDPLEFIVDADAAQFVRDSLAAMREAEAFAKAERRFEREVARLAKEGDQRGEATTP